MNIGGVRRKDVNVKSDKKYFKNTVDRTHRINGTRLVMRGGVRL